MKEPTKPNQEDCCNSGCNPCIFDVYEKQLKLYKLYTENGHSPDTTLENAMSQLEYKGFLVIENNILNNDHNLILFDREDCKSKTMAVFWEPGDHFLVKYSNEDLTCTRAYTPIKIDSNKNCDFAIIVKKYDLGLVSNYLCSLKIGDLTLWRGPYGKYKMSSEFSRIIMIAQGTGVAPFYSIIKQILDDEENFTKIILLYCCKDVNSILLRNEIYSFRLFWNFWYEIYIIGNTEELVKYQEPLVRRRFDFGDIIKFKPYCKKDQFLLCGSSAFMEHYSSLLLKEDIDLENVITF